LRSAAAKFSGAFFFLITPHAQPSIERMVMEIPHVAMDV
jgi:hypothetical protein